MKRSNPLQDRTYSRPTNSKKKPLRYLESSGNIFRDLGLEDAEELLQKSNLKTAKLIDFKDNKEFFKEYSRHEKEIDRAYKLYFDLIAYLKKRYWTKKKLSCGAGVTVTLDKNGRKTKKIKIRYKMCRVFDESKLFGFKAIQYLDEFVKKHPGIYTVNCEDNFHGASKLYLIPHLGKEFHGTRIIFVPLISEDRTMLLNSKSISSLISALLGSRLVKSRNQK
jgi:hypothetical protein